MKKLAIAAIAASIFAVPAAADAQQRTIVRERPNATVVINRGPGYQQRQVIQHNNQRNVRQNVIVRQNQRAIQQQRAIRQQQRIAHRQWQRGQRFDRRYAANYRQIDYRQYQRRGVYAPPRGYQWVQSGNDAVLISIASGLIGAVIGGAIFN
ncbi:RcnB family protein [Sphingomonas aestuarii]|jgi:Ni/Co efflux regulator RcnB